LKLYLQQKKIANIN